MQIKLNKNEIETLNEILYKRDLNILASDFVNIILEQYYDLLEREDFISSNKEKEYFTLLMNKSDISMEKEELLEIINNNKIDVFNQLNINEYKQNDYLKTIKFNNIKQNKFTLSNNYYSEFECFLYDEVEENNFIEINKIGYFEEKFNYPIINERKITWMSITPYEINTMKKDINNAKGKVLTLGLGLGYYTFMVSNKEEVEEVTIVEKNIEVIDLFTNNILQSFPNKKKIKIINNDAINYLKNNKKDYDYVFCDIHHNEEEGLILLLEFIEKKIKIKNLHFWINKSILLLVRRYLLTLIEEYYQGYTKENYQEKNNYEEIILAGLYEIYKDINISSSEEIKQLLSLKEIEKKLYSFFL